jgi:hypothetical protein
MVCFAVGSRADSPLALIEKLDNYPHAVPVSHSSTEVRDHEIGLGAIQKVRGVWRFKDSERQTGTLHRHTWQIVDGFSSLEVYEELVSQLDSGENSELLFSCEGRSCGQSVQWANRVFAQRMLYGREEMQRYRVYRWKEAVEYRVILYSSARTADRQHLHMEVIQLAP